MNKSDSERIASILKKANFSFTLDLKKADFFILNMCSVRQSAVDRVYGLAKKLQKLKSQNPKLKTALTGCVSLEDAQKLKTIFDFILPIKTLPSWPEILERKNFYLIVNQRNEQFLKECQLSYLKIKPSSFQPFSVFIPISTGCDNFCSFCIVPFVRGPLICRSHKKILKEAKEAVKDGAKEIWLLGQNVNDYQSPTDPSINFSKLLKMINEIEGNFWIRFTSPHPKNFSDELIETMAKCEKFTPYLNLPVQSGDDEILRKMNRPYTVKDYKKLIKKIRSAFKKYRKGLEKEVAISTDVIVGFPGETKRQFQNTVKLFREIKFDMAYIAEYSQRPGTAAAKLKDDISSKEKKERYRILTEILKRSAFQKNKKFIGKEILVLAEEFKDGFLIGKSKHYKTVKFEGKKDLFGQFVKVKILKALPWALKGKIKRGQMPPQDNFRRQRRQVFIPSHP